MGQENRITIIERAGDVLRGKEEAVEETEELEGGLKKLRWGFENLLRGQGERVHLTWRQKALRLLAARPPVDYYSLNHSFQDSRGTEIGVTVLSDSIDLPRSRITVQVGELEPYKVHRCSALAVLPASRRQEIRKELELASELLESLKSR